MDNPNIALALSLLAIMWLVLWGKTLGLERDVLRLRRRLRDTIDVVLDMRNTADTACSAEQIPEAEVCEDQRWPAISDEAVGIEDTGLCSDCRMAGGPVPGCWCHYESAEK